MLTDCQSATWNKKLDGMLGGKQSLREKWIKENNATILIQDNGIGISEDELFSILNGKCKKGSLGAGIYNANNVLVKYYGKEYKVNIKSELNIGTNVSFKLPL